MTRKLRYADGPLLEPPFTVCHHAEPSRIPAHHDDGAPTSGNMMLKALCSPEAAGPARPPEEALRPLSPLA